MKKHIQMWGAYAFLAAIMASVYARSLYGVTEVGLPYSIARFGATLDTETGVASVARSPLVNILTSSSGMYGGFSALDEGMWRFYYMGMSFTDNVHVFDAQSGEVLPSLHVATNVYTLVGFDKVGRRLILETAQGKSPALMAIAVDGILTAKENQVVAVPTLIGNSGLNSARGVILTSYFNSETNLNYFATYDLNSFALLTNVLINTTTCVDQGQFFGGLFRPWMAPDGTIWAPLLANTSPVMYTLVQVDPHSGKCGLIIPLSHVASVNQFAYDSTQNVVFWQDSGEDGSTSLLCHVNMTSLVESCITVVPPVSFVDLLAGSN